MAVTGAFVAFSLSRISSGPFGVLLAAFAAVMVVVIVGLILDRTFRLGLLSRLTEPFPILAQVADNIQRKVYGDREERK